MGYSLYAAVSFAVVVVVLFYRDKLRHALQTRQVFKSVEGVRLELQDALFEPAAAHR